MAINRHFYTGFKISIGMKEPRLFFYALIKTIIAYLGFGLGLHYLRACFARRLC